MTTKKTLVIVGMRESSHLQTWIKHLVMESIFSKIVIVPSDYPTKTSYSHFKNMIKSNKNLKIYQIKIFKSLDVYLFRILDYIFDLYWRNWILRFVNIIFRPQFIHFHELQHGAYINLFGKTINSKQNKSTIVASIWGSDLQMYYKLPEHKSNLSKVMRFTDILTSERSSDEEIARQLGFQGKFYSPVFISVGQNNLFNAFNLVRTSERRFVLIKGYQNNFGRALNSLAAIERIPNSLKNFKFFVYSPAKSVKFQVHYLKNFMDFDIECLPRIKHEELLELMKKSRLYIGLSTSDGLPVSMVEAMQFGVFPIQSQESSAKDFFVNGEGGFIVDPWDVVGLASKIQESLVNDFLVDQAAKINKYSLNKKYLLDEGLKKFKLIYSN